MAKQIINVGTSANSKNGDSLRSAFQKVNANFTELYNSIGGAGLEAVAESIIPTTDNTYDIGSPSKRWRHGYFATGSLYVGDIKLSNNAGKLEITKVINPGEDNEAEDPEDSDAGSEIGGRADLGDLVIYDGAITTDGVSSIIIAPNGEGYGYVIVPNDTSAVAGAATVIGNSRNDGGGVQIAAYNNTWTFGPDGDLTLPFGGDILDSNGQSVLGGGGGAANLGNLKIDGNTLGTQGADSNSWGNHNLYLDPGGESNAYISIPSVPNQEEGNALQIYNKGDATSIVQVFGRGGVQVVTNTGEDEHVFEFRDDGGLTLPGTLDYRIGESFGGGSLAITSEGAVNIFTNSVEGFKLWQFDGDGNLQLPVGGEIRFSYGYIDQDDDVQGNALRISGGDSVVIKTDEDGKTWEFDNRGVLRLPADGDIINSSGQSVLGGGSYTPDDTDNWEDPAVNTIQAALDELAARMTAFENFEIDGGNAYTPAAGELLIDGNGA